MRHYYFGCYKQTGHRWYTSRDGFIISEYYHLKELDLHDLQIDAAFAPRYTREEGVCNLWHLNTGHSYWTILSFWDYSIDARPGSHSNFVFDNKYSFDEIMLLINEYYSKIIERFIFKIKYKEKQC